MVISGESSTWNTKDCWNFLDAISTRRWTLGEMLHETLLTRACMQGGRPWVHARREAMQDTADSLPVGSAPRPQADCTS